jgi:hypothetical protein
MTTPSQTTTSPIPVFQNVRTLFGALGVVGWIGLIAAATVFGPNGLRSFFSAFTFGFIFWMVLTMGALTLTFLHHSIRATWSLSILRVVEAANKTVPAMFIMWLILAAGLVMHQLYSWNNPDVVGASEVLQRKQWWLNQGGWLVRGVIYFLYWLFMTNKLNSSSRRQDTSHDDREAAMRANWGAPGGVIHILLLTFATTDWIMSLDPTWYSTIYGVWWMMFGFRVMLAIGIITVVGLNLRGHRPFKDIVTPLLTKDIGNMLLGFTMLWGYFSLSQFLIIWSGNLPEEIPFYINRFTGPLVYVGAFLVFAQFFFPFLCLIAGRTKREGRLLVLVSCWIVVMSIVDAFWQVVPFFKVGFSAENLGSYLLDFAGWAAVGAVWVGVFTTNLIKFARENALYPVHDTRLLERKAEWEAHELEHHHA